MIVRQLWEELPDNQEVTPAPGSGGRRGRGRGSGRGSGDVRVKLERSRQSARECRAMKKLRYQYLDDMIAGETTLNYKKYRRRHFSGPPCTLHAKGHDCKMLRGSLHC